MIFQHRGTCLKQTHLLHTHTPTPTPHTPKPPPHRNTSLLLLRPFKPPQACSWIIPNTTDISSKVYRSRIITPSSFVSFSHLLFLLFLLFLITKKKKIDMDEFNIRIILNKKKRRNNHAHGIYKSIYIIICASVWMQKVDRVGTDHWALVPLGYGNRVRRGWSSWERSSSAQYSTV